MVITLRWRVAARREEPRMSPPSRILIAFLAFLVLIEQPVQIWAQRPPAQTESEPGLVIIVEGIGGIDMVGKSAKLSFKHANLPHDVHRFIWTHGTGKFLTDLQDTQHVLKKADELASFIRDYRARYPNRRIYIVAKSGGTGLTLFALRDLPANTVERVILLSAAVSPNFDLRHALRATRGEIVSFHSRNDRMILSWGTSTFGTIDRHYGESAGLKGFVVPLNQTDEDRTLYRRLVQVPYTSRMLLAGVSNGSHSATSLPWFISSEVVPWLR
ncbi:MAG: alpha/beta hydrolase [Gemmataceae bacterium]|nr:alpha/beta hydrolase [Gemmataceae bacterium]